MAEDEVEMKRRRRKNLICIAIVSSA